MHDIHGRYGYDHDKYHPCTFRMNNKGGMDTMEFEEYIENSLVTLYPDAADTPCKHVLFKADSGPGCKNTELMAYLCIHGFYFIPDLPNSMQSTQEMELFIGELKSIFYKNLETLTHGCLAQNQAIPSGAEVVGLLLFGGSFFNNKPNENSSNEEFIHTFQVAGHKDKVRGYFKKMVSLHSLGLTCMINACTMIQQMIHLLRNMTILNTIMLFHVVFLMFLATMAACSWQRLIGNQWKLWSSSRLHGLLEVKKLSCWPALLHMVNSLR
jgi:hypothetical protein